MRHALVTGGAGFIGSHLVDRLLEEGWQVTVVDNYDSFYDLRIKQRNVQLHFTCDRYKLLEIDIRSSEELGVAFRPVPDVIVHLAAKAGVLPSIADPISYQEVNVRGTHNLLEWARKHGVKQFVFASSSSVYGINPRTPWREDDAVLLPISPYASTKVSGELLGHVYSHLFSIRFLALRFFTVYGPRQRPDLAIHKFARLMLDGQPVPLFGSGTSSRDYTYIADIVQGIRAAMDYSESLYEVINLGNNRTVSLMEMVRELADALGRKPITTMLPEQLGDVPSTWADIQKATRLLGYAPKTSFQNGIATFVRWLNHSTED